jgi:hypothetical protein
MEPTEKLAIEIVFSNVYYLISNKVLDISEISIAYLDRATEFFKNLIRSLDSLGRTPAETEEENSTFFLFPNLKEVVSSVPDTPINIDENDLAVIKKVFYGFNYWNR